MSVNDRLFETLDPTTRAFEHEGRRYLLTDTVGFIRRLPHQLVEGFAATLEETLAAELVLHVADGSAPDHRLDEQVAAVDAVLAEIGAGELPVELVINKIDAIDPLGRRRLRNRFPDAIQVSARSGEGLPELKARIAERFAERFEPVRLLIPHSEGARLAELYELGAPIEHRSDRPDGVAARRAASARRAGALRALSRRRRTVGAGTRVIELQSSGCGPRRRFPAARTRGTRVSTSPPCERVVLASRRARGRPDRDRGGNPGGIRRLRPAALGTGDAPRDHRRELARARGLGLSGRA